MSDVNGNLYLVGTERVYAFDEGGKVLWEKPLGSSQSPFEIVSPSMPVLDPRGYVHVSGLDATVHTLRIADGSVLSSWPLGLVNGFPRLIQMGVAGFLLVDRSGISADGPKTKSLGLFSTDSGAWAGEITDGAGWFPENAIAGFELGIVAYGYHDTTPGVDTSETIVLDSCGRLKWRVPGSYSWPVAITFGDDLIVRDRLPLADGTYRQQIRRFSKDGTLLAGPKSTGLLLWAVAGGDDEIVAVTCDTSQTRIVGFDSSLNQAWSVALGEHGCPTGTVLNASGILFVATIDTETRLFAVQTPSPGPAPVSWGRYLGGDVRGTFWLSPR